MENHAILWETYLKLRSLKWTKHEKSNRVRKNLPLLCIFFLIKERFYSVCFTVWPGTLSEFIGQVAKLHTGPSRERSLEKNMGVTWSSQLSHLPLHTALPLSWLHYIVVSKWISTKVTSGMIIFLNRSHRWRRTLLIR